MRFDRKSQPERVHLTRRGMFLSIIGQKHVPLKALPPLHIPTTEACVCEVARTGRERYDEDVHHEEDSYLKVVSSTNTQFTVPLIWRNDIVGVLVVGLSVLDGLEPRHQPIIKAIAGYCAAAIAGSQRTAEERAVSHMLGEVLTGAALENQSGHRERRKQPVLSPAPDSDTGSEVSLWIPVQGKGREMSEAADYILVVDDSNQYTDTITSIVKKAYPQFQLDFTGTIRDAYWKYVQHQGES